MSADLEARVAKLENRVEELESQLDGEIMPAHSDIEGILDKVDPSTHVERATAIGFHIVHNRGQGPFTSSEIKDAYRECRIQLPQNMSDVLANAHQRGWLIEAGKKGQVKLWNVSRDADEAVTEGFQE
jgi:hypothetical protein